MTAVVAVLALAAAPAALAGLDKELSIFDHCPLEDPATAQCVVSTTSSGEFKMGSKEVPVEKEVVLQGGITAAHELLPAVGAETLSRTPLRVPGGLVGVEILEVLGPLYDVTATAELAGQALINPGARLTEDAATLPLKVKLDNPALGANCYIGSDAEPVLLHMTMGTTSPPAGVEPLTGKTGTPVITAHGKLITAEGASLVDNTFPVPGVTGCGGPVLELLADPATDLVAGLPSAAGNNRAIMNGNLSVATARNIIAQRKLPELGRCVKVPGEKVGKEVRYHGGYNAAGCVEERVDHKGQFEWLPGPGEHKGFTTKTGKVQFPTVVGHKVKCIESHGSGEYTGPKSATVSTTLTGCTDSAGSCHTPGAGEGEVTLPGLSATLGFIEDREVEKVFKFSIGWDLAKSPSLASAECGASKETMLLTGSVIGKIETLDKPTTGYNVKFTQLGGKQVPESFEEEPNDTISASFGGGAPEAAELVATDKVTNAEKIEFIGEHEE